MKIAILADPLDGQYAGIHVYTRELIDALNQFDKKNEYVLVRQKKGAEFPGMKQVVVPNFPVYTGFQVLRVFFLFPLILRKLKVDAVVEPAHFGPFNLPKRMKRITVIHDLTPIKFPGLHRFYSQALQRIFLRGILKRAHLILTNSENTSRDTLEFYPGSEKKIKRIYLGKEDIFKPDFHSETISKFGLDEPYFLFVGTIEPRKNLLVLLKAYTAFRQAVRKPVRLIIAGQLGWKAEPEMEALAQHPFKNDIVITGYVKREELPVLYTNARAFIYPSKYEGFGLPVLEAMACGAPCLVSDSSSLPEVGGEAALYFSPADSDKLCSLMIAVNADEGKRDEMRKRSLGQAEKFSWKKCAEEFMDAIETLT
ncbi:MAG: glycosyltransferase family 4 protein [Bacteroidales bacterium]|nr:glycosyltransferase family 4 protein [Bacteroidales bacterium]